MGDAKGDRLFWLAPALGSWATLDTASFRALDVVSRDPVLVVDLGARGDSRTLAVRCHRASIDFLDGGFLAWLALLREVGHDPDGVEEIADADGTCKEEEVQEEPSEC